MDCREWEAGLDELLEERCDAVLRAALAEHAAACPRCGKLWALAHGDPEELLPPGAPDLTDAVLALTTGPACGRAGALLAALPDGAPALGDAQLLQAHLEHCPACRALADTLAWLSPELRAMAEVEPDTTFAADVLAATAGLLARRRHAHESGAARRVAIARRAREAERLWARLEAWQVGALAWWRRQLRRPQFAFEFAYVATMLLIAVFATPISPLRHAPQKALAVVQASPAGFATLARDLYTVLPGDVRAAGDAAWQRVGGRAEQAAGEAAQGLRARGERTAGTRAVLRQHAGELAHALVRFEFVQAAVSWDQVRTDLGRFWREWRGPQSNR